MSTIKSSAENLTLNADGANNDIIFQSNGSNVATLDQAGLLTATTFAGSGANLTSLPNGSQLDHSGTKKIEATANGATITGGSSTASNLTITSTATDDNIAPDLILYRNSASPADNDNLGGIIWQGNDDAGNATSYAQIVCKTEDVSDGTEDALLRFYTATGGSMSEKMRLTKEGCLAIGMTEASVYAMRVNADVGNGGYGIAFHNTSGVSVVGAINTTGSSTSYNTSSDYRLKENVDYTWDATTRLKQLKPARFNFIADDTNTLVDGFIAHEVQTIVPEAVSGTKDAMMDRDTYDANGNVNGTESVIDPQGIDQSKLVPLLVKTIQELEARITAGGL